MGGRCGARAQAPAAGGRGGPAAPTAPGSGSLIPFAADPRAISSAGRAPPRQGGGHWFEPSIAHRIRPRVCGVFCVNGLTGQVGSEAVSHKLPTWGFAITVVWTRSASRKARDCGAWHGVHWALPSHSGTDFSFSGDHGTGFGTGCVAGGCLASDDDAILQDDATAIHPTEASGRRRHRRDERAPSARSRARRTPGR